MQEPRERPLYLDTQPDGTFGFLHSPAVDERSATGVLICPPFGWDEVCSYGSRREWAAKLASDGHPALRIDLPSTGDSAGLPTDSDRLGAWTGAVGAAAEWLRVAEGCQRVVAIGIGLGGLLACRAAALGAPIDDFVLWAVPARGKTLLRELRAFARLAAAEFPDPEAVVPPPLPDGYLEAGGFLMTDETAAGLEAIDLTALELPGPGGRRALLIERDGVSVDARLRAALEGQGVTVATAPGPGYGQMMTNPQWARPPRAVFESVAAWLAAEVPERPAGDGPVRVARAAERLTLEIDGIAVNEAPVLIEQPFGHLVGVLAEPAAGPASDLAMVLVNGGAVRRIGPNRMWVELARRWAARGLPTLRVDIEGLGDSDGDGDRYAEVAEMYAMPLADQVRAVLDALEERGVARTFIVGGLCAGAFWSFHVLREDDRAAMALMLNLFSFFWEDDLPTARDVSRLRELRRFEVWKRILRGQVGAQRVRAFARWLLRTPLDLRKRLDRRRTVIDQVDEALDGLHSAGKRGVLVLGRGEQLLEQFRRERRLDRLERWPNLELHQIPARDHTFRAIWLQRHVHDVLDGALARELERRGVIVPRDPREPVPRPAGARTSA